MDVDQHVQHVLTVTGTSTNSFDEAVKNTIQGAWENHHEEFARFVSYNVLSFDGQVGKDLEIVYKVTLAISAIHAEHDH